ncbi:alpha hydrolase [Methanocella sp. CWC-04]|uniref:Alpha hydrolase n=1 Tax=Methanooceanicella nereidis TaxID=2052831 RepID=A0AAP2W7R8_9EURY|nr:alpha hydrolase [Methanocella sp. CWC-04]MCD1295331.1 alpha hydrolase [Methanocella sp. CWC-04]
MKVQVLYSGGKDSSLSAILLEPFFEVELVTCTFGLERSWENARQAAHDIGFPFKLVKLDPKTLDESIEVMLKFGYPRYGINLIHKEALETVAALGEAAFIADGTRRDDRAPMLNISEIRSLEDRTNIRYVRPLAGYGKSAIDALVREHLEIVEANSETLEKADYETEARSLMRDKYGEDVYHRIFPHKHIQSRVLRRFKHDEKVER